MILWWRPEDAAYVVDVPELPGCLAHRATRQDAIKNAEHPIKFWLKTTPEDVLQVPQPRGRFVFTSLTQRDFALRHAPASSRRRRPQSPLRGAEIRLRTVEWPLRETQSRSPTTEFSTQDTEYKPRAHQSQLRVSESTMREIQFRLREIESLLMATEF